MSAAELRRRGEDMKITWIGHSCFKIESNGYTVIIDPYEDGYVPGLKPLREKANAVLCSHEHGDHNARDLVKIEAAGADKDCPVSVEKIETWHDEVRGAKRGPNTIHIIADGNIRLAHMGDLGCDLTDEQIEVLKNIDVCLIPVGGHFTIDGKQAASIVRQIDPRVVIPMHYRDDIAGFGFDVISQVDVFADCMDQAVTLKGSCISTDKLQDARVIVLEPANKMD